MKRLAVRLSVIACLVSACSLEFTPCGESGINCGGSESVCVCETGRCAEPDEDCVSGLHYVAGRCVTEAEARSAVPSTPDDPGVCRVADGGSDSDVHDAADGG